MDSLSDVKKNFINYINNIVKYNKISHAYLIEVDNYDDDYKYIISFIKMIFANVCYEDTFDDNNKMFHLIDSNSYPDLMIVSTELATIKKSLMIDLKKEFNNKSLTGNKKIYIIKEVDKFNLSSANTMLKFLEEPEENIIAFLITTNRYNVIDTILSRCQILSLKENNYNIDISDDMIDFISYILNPKTFFINYKDNITNNYSEKTILKELLRNVEKYFISYLSDVNNNEDVFDMLSKQDNNRLVKILSIIETEIVKLDYNVNYKLWIDSFFAKLIGG